MRKTHRWLAALLALTLVLSLVPAAFADEGGETPSEPAIDLSSLRLDKTTLSLTAEGETATLTVLDGSTEMDASEVTITWSSDHESVARVAPYREDSGEEEPDDPDQNSSPAKVVITPVSAGNTTVRALITAPSGSQQQPKWLTCSVTVTAAAITSIDIELEADELDAEFGGDTWINIKEVTANLSNGKTTDITKRSNLVWSVQTESSNISLPVATGKGRAPIRVHGEQVTGEKPAEVTVTISYEGVTSSTTCKITVTPKVRVIITEYQAGGEVKRLNATMGETKTLQAFITENENKHLDWPITWSSGDTAKKVIEIKENQDGTLTVTPKGVGSATITASYVVDGKTVAKEEVVCVVSAAPVTDPDDPGSNTPGTTLPDGVTISSVSIDKPKTASNEVYVMDPGTAKVEATVVLSVAGANGAATPVSRTVEWTRGGDAVATYTVNRTTYTIPVTWKSTNTEVAAVSSGNLRADKAGRATITASAGKVTSSPLEVEVSGFEVDKTKVPVRVEENDSAELPLKSYGNADRSKLTIWSNNTTVVRVENGKIVAYTPGETTITVSSGSYRETFDVIVDPDSESTIPGPNDSAIVIGRTDTLPFSDSRLTFRNQAGGELSHITGLNVDPAKGTLYYNYKSETSPGAGVGAENYYLTPPTSGQRAIEDITFVPNPNFNGGQVTISYSAVSTGGKNYGCKILLTVNSGADGTAGNMRLSTKYNTAVRLSGSDFNSACQDRLGVSLDNVTFTQPSPRQGTLYTDYVNASNYGTVVSISTQYSRRNIDNIWFVPAPGFTSTAVVNFTARGVGPSGESYSGQLTIHVSAESGVSMGGLAYNTSTSSPVTFDDADFNDYRYKVLSNGANLSHIQFTGLPTASQGTLYYDYRSASNSGSTVSTNTNYYYGTRAPRIDRITFVPAAGYTGTVRIPFTGWDQTGSTFTGNVEVNVREGSGSGDIRYTCGPGRTVYFKSSDFTSLSRDLTGRTLSYIRFQNLPNSSDGALYYNSSRINSTSTQYNSNNLSRLSFRASGSFGGSVDIPFTGYATNGDSFYGVITIDSTGSGVSGLTLHYTTTSGTAAVFQRSDFNDLSQWETDRNINYVRFEIPSSSQGDLYRNYSSSSSKGTRLTSNATSIYANDLSRVAFIPASSYTGMVYLDFKATSLSGDTLNGTVEITVNRAPADATAYYSTRTAPVRFSASDLARRNYTLSSIRIDALPNANAGYLYYQYASPTRYGQQVSAGNTYQASGSNLISDLTFVPRAGYAGTVEIPYTGTNSNGSTFTGEVQITVSPSYSSAHFNDMGPYTDAERAAVDFLYDLGVTNGISATEYGPESAIRRGDFAKMVYIAFDLTPSSYTNVFQDVPSSAYYAEAVNALYARGIVNGVSRDSFAPGSTLTRQDAVCMIQRAMRSMGWNASEGSSSILSAYGDSDNVSNYAQGAMSFAVRQGYLPISGGSLNPKQPLSRVDMAQLLHRVLTYN